MYDWFPCALFPCSSPCTPLVFISVPFMSLSVPLGFPFISRCFPVMSTSYFHPVFLAKQLFFQHFRKEDVQKTQSFSSFSAKGAVNPNQQKSWQGESSLGSLFCHTGSPKTERHQTTARHVGGTPQAPHVSDILYPLRKDEGAPAVRLVAALPDGAQSVAAVSFGEDDLAGAAAGKSVRHMP